jgi:hypothetical protein
MKNYEDKQASMSGKGLEELRRMWEEAVADDRPGPPPAEVFARLLRKYSGRASKSG